MAESTASRRGLSAREASGGEWWPERAAAADMGGGKRSLGRGAGRTDGLGGFKACKGAAAAMAGARLDLATIIQRGRGLGALSM